MAEKNAARTIIMPHDSYVTIGDERKEITSIRISKNPKLERFEVMLISTFEVVQKFGTEDLNIRIYKDEDEQIDVLEFLKKKKHKIAEIYISHPISEDMYKDYIKAMMI